jgi:predicted transcriptional regulator
MNRLGELERAIMEVLWRSPDPMTVRQVGICLTDRDLAHTTVMTVLDRLAKKGFVRRQRAGRAWRYRPAESREAYVAELMLTALDQTGDRQAALTRFASSVSGAEAQALRVALDALSGCNGSRRGSSLGGEPSRGDGLSPRDESRAGDGSGGGARI